MAVAAVKRREHVAGACHPQPEVGNGGDGIGPPFGSLCAEARSKSRLELVRAGEVRRSISFNGGAVIIEGFARHQAGLGPRIGHVQPLHLDFQIEIIEPIFIDEVELIGRSPDVRAAGDHIDVTGAAGVAGAGEGRKADIDFRSPQLSSRGGIGSDRVPSQIANIVYGHRIVRRSSAELQRNRLAIWPQSHGRNGDRSAVDQIVGAIHGAGGVQQLIKTNANKAAVDAGARNNLRPGGVGCHSDQSGKARLLLARDADDHAIPAVIIAQRQRRRGVGRADGTGNILPIGGSKLLPLEELWPA